MKAPLKRRTESHRRPVDPLRVTSLRSFLYLCCVAPVYIRRMETRTNPEDTMSTDPRDVATIVEERDAKMAQRGRARGNPPTPEERFAHVVALEEELMQAQVALRDEREGLAGATSQEHQAPLRDEVRELRLELGQARAADHEATRREKAAMEAERDALEAERDAAAPVIDAAEAMIDDARTNGGIDYEMSHNPQKVALAIAVRLFRALRG